jgi:membrane-associated phospholipid phosphatase
VRTARSVKGLIAAAASALVAAAVTVPLLGVGSANPLDSNPQPALFPRTVVQPLGAQLAAQKPAADRAYATWARTHPRADDAAFVAFAVAQTPSPPTPVRRARELTEVQALATARTGDYVSASTWLELYGKTEIWKTYRHQYADVRPKSAGQAAKAELAHTRSLTKQVTAAAQARFHLDAPFIADPALRTDKTVTPGTHKLSYPSKHAVEVFSAMTLMDDLEPLRAAEFTDMADQVAYSRLYMAGHYRSDLIAGAYLGYLIGDYEVDTAA